VSLLEVSMIVVTEGTEGNEVRSWRLTARSPEIERWRRVSADAVAALGGDEEAVMLARLGVSELLSNVVKHVADPRCLLVIAGEGSDFRITVRDRSTAAPAVTRPAWDSDSGRGLWLLREMARDLGYTCFPGGKAVWFRCPLRSLSEVAVR
jgi:serine/threonine-protein kinase RsbW